MKKKILKFQSQKKDYSLILSISITLIFVAIISIAGGFLYNFKFTCANSISCIKDITGLKESVNQGIFLGKTVYSPLTADFGPLAQNNTSQVLAEQSGDYKRIYVDLTNQKLYAFEGNTIIMNVPVSTGKWYPTPTGDFRIWIWLRYTRMSGGSGAGYYNLPNVPYVMYFYNNSYPKARGYGLHGAYWHNNFGHPMSHGCVNMRIEDAEKLFYWTNTNVKNVSYSSVSNPGTLITIYGQTPSE